MQAVTTREDEAHTRSRRERGVVRRSTARGLEVATRLGSIDAAVAFSCLVAPEPGDVVELSVARAGSYVTGVLARPEGGGARRISSDGDLELTARGVVTVEGADGVRVDGGPRLDVSAAALSAVGATASLSAGLVEVAAREVSTRCATLRTVARRLDVVAGDLKEQLVNAFRDVAGSDVRRARDIETRAERLMSLKAGHASLVADALVRVDGEQIHMG